MGATADPQLTIKQRKRIFQTFLSQWWNEVTMFDSEGLRGRK